MGDVYCSASKIANDAATPPVSTISAPAAYLCEERGRAVPAAAAYHVKPNSLQARDQGHSEPIFHAPVPEQGRWLGQVVREYLAYHAVPTNARAITAFVHYVTWHWKRALGRRGQKGRMTWERIAKIAARWLPSAKIQHPYPQQPFIAKHPRWEPSALAAHAWICPGGAG